MGYGPAGASSEIKNALQKDYAICQEVLTAQELGTKTPFCVVAAFYHYTCVGLAILRRKKKRVSTRPIL